MYRVWGLSKTLLTNNGALCTGTAPLSNTTALVVKWNWRFSLEKQPSTKSCLDLVFCGRIDMPNTYICQIHTYPRIIGAHTHRYAKYLHILGLVVLRWRPPLVVAVLRLRVNFEWWICHGTISRVFYRVSLQYMRIYESCLPYMSHVSIYTHIGRIFNAILSENTRYGTMCVYI